MPIIATTISPPAAVGRYASQSDIESQFGIDNVRVWSQLDNSLTTADLTRIQSALDFADAKIISTFAQFGNYATPLNPINEGIPLARRWAAVIAGTWLYQSRGLRDTDPLGDHIARLTNLVELEMLRYRGPDKFPASPRWPTATAPTPATNYDH
jgi:phage gp36-like protein